MAIDDNTLYGLTGAQIKELPGKIDAVKGMAKVLTTADYNWNNTAGDSTTEPFDSLAVWLLDAGVYSFGEALNVKVRTLGYGTYSGGSYMIVGKDASKVNILIQKASDSTITVGATTLAGAIDTDYKSVLNTSSVVDNLTSTSTTNPLSAKQGKVLKDMIDALPTGGVTELTSADYNYPTANPDGIALWLLDSGMYQISSPGATIQLYHYSSPVDSGAYRSYGDGTTFLVIENREGGNTTKNIYINNWWYNDWANTGALNTGNYYDTGDALMTHKSIIDSLTSNAANAPLSAKQGKVLKDLVDSLAVRGAGAPTTSTVGQVGTLYEDTTNGDLYICTDATNPYVWEAVGGGGGPTVVQTTGTSTTDVMSQNAVTSMVYADPASRNKLQLGKDAVNMGTNSGIAIGQDAFVASGTTHALAVGYNAAARATNSVALGAQSNATAQGEMSIGNSTRTDLYNNTGYRLLTGLYDPQSAHDAATKGYVDSQVGSTFTTNEWNALWA